MIMRKLFFPILLLAAVGSFAQTLPQVKTFSSYRRFIKAAPQPQTPQQIVQRYYRQYSQQHRCYRVDIDALNVTETSFGGEYCMRQIKSEIRQTAQGKLMYLLYTGDNFDFNRGESIGGRVQSGLAGIFVLKQVSGGWQPLAVRAYNQIGTYGYAPEAKYWSFLRFGKDRWGFMTPMSYLSDGYSSSEYILFTHNGAGKIGRSTITSNTTNGYGLNNCQTNPDPGKPLTAAERRECRAKWYRLTTSSFRILTHARPNAGFYPLRLSVSGFNGFKYYRNQAFIIHYDAAAGEYTMPTDYPLANK